jgi:hypothetical protein
MNKIIELQPGVVFVLSDWGSTVVRAYDTRTITTSHGTFESHENEEEKDDRRRSEAVTAARSRS